MSGETVLEGVNSDGVHREFVRCAENTNRNFLYAPLASEDISERGQGSYTTILDKDLCQRSRVACRLPAHRLDGVHGRAGRAGRDRKDGGQPWRVEGIRGHGAGGREERESLQKLQSIAFI